MLGRVLAAILALTGVAAAQTPGDEALYQAIRGNDAAAMRLLARDHGVETKDGLGQTPLMVAAAFGTRDTVRWLLDQGASPRAASHAGVTALHWAVTDLAKTRMLLDAGADVNAVTQLGRTPLIIAASAPDAAGVVQLLLDRGADANVADAIGITPLIAASVVNNSDAVRLLLDRGADVNVTGNSGPVTTALMGASTNGNIDLVRLLLGRQAHVRAVTTNAAGSVKNGPVQFGRMTALHFAALSGSADVVRELLNAGAVVDAVDVRGMTPLMLAIATDRPEPRIIDLLLEAGANPSLRSTIGESAIDWARKFQHPAVLAALKLPVPDSGRGRGVEATRGPVVAHGPDARAAAERALPLMRAASGKMLTQGGCVACHAQPLTGLAVNLARARGWTTALADAEASQSLAQLTANLAPLLQLREGGGLPDGLVYVALLLADNGTAPTRATDALVRYLAAKQRHEGFWEGVGGTRAPMQDGNFSRTALSIRALTTYATPALALDYAARTEKAAAWLASQTPISTEDRVMQLLGLHWAKADAAVRQARIRELLDLQRLDGGWSQTPHLQSDAYATGQVLYTLRELGIPAADDALRRGVAFLTGTQLEDGSWHVINRAMKLQPYFDGGFPHDHDQWISHAGTSWAVIGLAAAAVEAPAATRTSR